MTTITLREYGATRWEKLDARQVEELRNASESWRKTLGLPSTTPPLKLERDGDLVGISAQGVSGTIMVGSVNIEIAPKFLDHGGQDARDWRHAFWEILTITQEGRALFGSARGADAESLSIADLLAEIFLRSFARGSTRGLPLQYTEVNELAPTVRGAFDHDRFAQWLVEPWRVPTRETTLTNETPLAKLLGWAASQLRTLSTSPARARELDGVRHSLPGAGRATPSLEAAERIQLGVQHEGLRQALEVALLLLRGHGVRHGDGEREVIGFLWRSDDVYERFLFWLCREAARSRGLLVRKSSARFGLSATAPPLTTTPDVMFAKSGSVVAVLDAKYKNLNATPKAGDSYQILTAANHFGCDGVGLVYPASTPRAETHWVVASALGGRPVTVSALSLDLLDAATTGGRRKLVDVIGGWLDGLSLATGVDYLELAAP